MATQPFHYNHLIPPMESNHQMDPKERERHIKAFLPFIKYQALKMAARVPSNVEVQDLMHAGIVGLLEALEKYDPSRGTRLKTYAEFRIRGAILDELRKMDWATRSTREKIKRLEEVYSNLEKKLKRAPTEEEMARSLGMGLDEFYNLLNETKTMGPVSIEDIFDEDMRDRGDLPDIGSVKNPHESCALNELRTQIAEALKGLKEKERLVMTLYYFEELTMKEIGMVMGITESRVSQIHSKALLKLRARLKRLAGEEQRH